MSLGDGAAALRAMAHPLRLKIMSLLTGAPMTAADVARELDVTHANASYHLRNLLAAGVIVADGEEKIRGGVAKRYRYDAHRDRPREPMTDDELRVDFTAIANELIRRTRTAKFVPGSKLLTDADLWIEPGTWQEIKTRVLTAMRDLHDAAKPPRTPGTVRTSTTAAMFQYEEH